MDDVQCTGEECSLDQCRFQRWGRHDCWHDEDVSVKCRLPEGVSFYSKYFNVIQEESNGSNIFGTMKRCLGQELFELMSFNRSARSGGIIWISFRFPLQ